ncbi:huntingtin [Hetaerina americana]|uniref:huntingtin n=1 Tax=Hetaerina americana TaxID=62018 RepID=UPI003A7F5F52
MATLEKLVKAFEGLKTVQLSSPVYDESVRKKEKITHCITIADAMCNSGVKGSHDFSQLISVAIETLLQLCDDQDSNVRMIADESLNRIIRALTDTNVVKIQVELHKEIKKNGNARTLRAALWRFAELCHMIRPAKGKPYVVYLIPCIVQIAKRTDEEAVLETLAAALQKIFKSLGSFTTDNEIKILLNAFLQNLSSSSAVARRTAASSILSVCLHCRKPLASLDWALQCLLDIVNPILVKGLENGKTTFPVDAGPILGVLGCLRYILPHFYGSATSSKTAAPGAATEGSAGLLRHAQDGSHLPRIEKILQVYELCLLCAQHEDHNVVNAALETLQQLLRCPPSGLISLLQDSSSSVTNSTQFSGDVHLGSPTKNCSLCDDSLEENKRSLGDKSDSQDSNEEIFCEIDFDKRNKECDLGDGESDSISGSAVMETRLIENKTEVPQRPMELLKGHKYLVAKEGVSRLNGCLRFLVASFLLQKSDKSNSQVKSEGIQILETHTVPDSAVRVSVKALALGCVANALALSPHLFFLSLEPDSDEYVRFSAQSEDPKGNTSIQMTGQPISDILLFAMHTDPQLRGLTCVLIGNLIWAALVQSGGDFQAFSKGSVSLDKLVSLLVQGLEDESSLCCRQTLGAIQMCLGSLLESQGSPSVKTLLTSLLPLHKNPYWLVKVKLLEVVSELPMVSLSHMLSTSLNKNKGYMEQGHRSDFQDQVLHEILLPLLGDEDNRVRHAAAAAFVRIIPHLFFPADYPGQDPATARASCLVSRFLLPVAAGWGPGGSLPLPSPTAHLNGPPSPFGGISHNSSLRRVAQIEDALSRVVDLLSQSLLMSTSRYLTHGCCEALSMLSEEYLTTIYPWAWSCILADRSSEKHNPSKESNDIGSSYKSPAVSPACGLLSTALTLLTSTSVSLDLSAQTWLIKLAGNLISGMAVYCNHRVDSGGSLDGDNTPRQSWSVLGDRQLAASADVFLGHVAKITATFAHVLDETPPPHLTPHPISSSPSPSPNPSPGSTISTPTSAISTSSASAPSLPAVAAAALASPIKRRGTVGAMSSQSSGVSVDGLSIPSSLSLDRGRAMSPSKSSLDKEDKLEERKGGKGSYFSLSTITPHYMKIYDILKSAYVNYKITLDQNASEKFVRLLVITLEALSQLLEIASLHEIGRGADELLGHLKSTVSLAPTPTVTCVHQLLKCLFGSNLCAQWEEDQAVLGIGLEHQPPLSTRQPGDGFYSVCFQNACHELAHSLGRPIPFVTDRMSLTSQMPPSASSLPPGTAASSILSSRDEGPGWLNSLKRRSERKVSSIFKNFGRSSDKASLASYIRLFEPMVIKALKQYTVTSDVQLQCRVLLLLSQLVQLRVNYCLLDSEQIFIGFVLKQFEFIESGQIPQAEELIPCIFYFLVHLSYEKQHSKAIIGVPKIIQLCDGLMASGQPHVTHCVPALVPVVEDVFVVRGKGLGGGGSGSSTQAAELKELDTQREVLFSMLLRLSEYPQVLDLLAVVVRESRTESEELWRRWSRNAADAVLPLVAWGRVRLEGERDERMAMYGPGCPQASLHRFLAALAPPVLRPVDPLLRTLFSTSNHPSQMAAIEYAPSGKEGEVVGVERWLGMVLGVFLALLSPQQAKEEAILARLEALGLSLGPHIGPEPLKNESTAPPADPLGAALVLTPVSDSPEPLAPELIMAKFIFHVMRVVVKKIHHIVFDPASQRDSTYLQEQFCHFLLYCIHMFESGSYSRVTTVAIELVKSEGPGNEGEGVRSGLSKLFLELTPVCPLLSSLWCYILVLLEVSDKSLWSQMLGLHEEPSPLNGSAHSPLQTKSLGTSPCCNIEVVKKAGTILFCGFLRGGVRGVMAEHAAWLLVGHTEAVVRLSGEPPVRDFIAAVHQNSAASGLLVQALASRCQDLSSPSFAWNLLRCIEGVHPSQSGALLSQLLVPRLLSCPHLALSRRASALACRRAELLLVQHMHQPPPRPASPLSLSPGDLLDTTPVPTPTVGQLPKEELENLLEVMQEARLMRKHSRLVSLLNKLGSHCYDLSPIDVEHGRSFNPANVRNITANKNWYLGQVKRRCCESKCSGQEVAQLLSKLEFDDIISIMSCKDFNGSVLENCLKLGLQLTLQALQGWSKSNFGSFEDLKSPDAASPLYKASKITLLQSITRLNGLVPRPHQVFLPVGRAPTQKEDRYSSRLGELFADSEFWDALFQIIPSLTCYLHGLPRLSSTLSSVTQEQDGESNVENQEKPIPSKNSLYQVPEESIEDLSKFGILCLEAANWLVMQENGSHPKPQSLHYALEGAAAMLSCSVLSAWLAGDPSSNNSSHLSVTWIASGVSAVTRLTTFLLGGEQHLPYPFSIASSGLAGALEDPEKITSAHPCLQIAALIHWLERTKVKMPNIPKFLATPLKCIVIGLARMPLVNSYALVPPEALKQGWKVEPTGSYKTQLPPLPIEYLQEVEVLEQFIFRVALLGWISRQQFEEMWVAFLSVLSSSPNEGTSPDETLLMAQANSLAVQSMTALLMQTLLLPMPGNPSVSHLIHQSRDNPLEFRNSSIGQKLASIHELLCWRIRDFGLLGSGIHLQDVFHQGNLEKVNNPFRYGHSQVSLEYLWTSTGAFTESDSNEEGNENNIQPENKASKQCLERAQRLSESGLDLPSCLFFLLDLYSQWSNSQSPVPLHIIGESIRSLLALSDLFTDGMQFARMLRSSLSLLRIHAPEDQLTSQYLVLGACKAAAVLVANMSPASPDMEAQDRVRRALELGLRSSFMPTRLASIHGLLYLLQAAFSRNHIVGGVGPIGNRDESLGMGSLKRNTTRQSRGEINMQQLSGKAGEVVRRAVASGVGIVQAPLGSELQLLLPIAMDYIQRNFGDDLGSYELEHHEEHTLLLWALIFTLLQSLEEGREETIPLLSSQPSASAHHSDGREGTASLPPILRLALSMLSHVASTPASSPTSCGPFNPFSSSPSKSHSITLRIYLALMQGLERLIVSGCPVGSRVRISAASLAAELLRHTSPVVALPALQLLLSCMYMGLNNVQREWSSIDQKGEVPGPDAVDSPNPEHLLHAMEQASALFDRVKRGYPFEVEVVCGVLPLLLTHFFPPSEILTKVIGEFLSSQQPHPRLLAAVLFQVFESACQQSQLPLLQEWVVLSLSNFTQCSPMGMATWCLTCFFISASTNPWLRAIFPHVQSRIGRCEFEDRRLLCIAASDFYHELTNDSQKQTFLSTFGTAANVHPQSPFSDIVTCLT